MREQFWLHYRLEELAEDEWEALCDGCGRCCLHRFERARGDGYFLTRAACRLLDTDSCQCRDYAGRFSQVESCLAVRSLEPEQYDWLPETCAYRLLKAGESLPAWHPLMSGDRNSVITAGVSVAGQVFSEDHIHPDEIESLVLEPDVD